MFIWFHEFFTATIPADSVKRSSRMLCSRVKLMFVRLSPLV